MGGGRKEEGGVRRGGRSEEGGGTEGGGGRREGGEEEGGGRRNILLTLVVFIDVLLLASACLRLFKVDLPAMKPELGFAAGLSACLSIGDLSVIALFGNQNFQTLPWLMYQFMSSYKMKEAAVISLSLLLICYTFFYFFDRIFKIENA